MTPPSQNGWERYQELVLAQLEDLKTRIQSLEEKVDRLRFGPFKIMSGAVALIVVWAVARYT